MYYTSEREVKEINLATLEFVVIERSSFFERSLISVSAQSEKSTVKKGA